MRKLLLLLVPLLLAALLFAVPIRAQNVIGNQHTPANTLEGSHLFTGYKMTSISVTWHTQGARWLMIFDSQSIPTGAFTASTPLIVCQNISGTAGLTDGTANFDWDAHPVIGTTGLYAVISTNPAACTALTVDGANDWFAAQMQ